MLETPILIALVVLSDCRSRVVALPLMGRWSCCDAQSLTGSSCDAAAALILPTALIM